jgi:cytoskeletal protein CcmA (bactofilin family)
MFNFLLLILAAGILFVAPFLPALMEWLWPRDRTPLPLGNDHRAQTAAAFQAKILQLNPELGKVKDNQPAKTRVIALTAAEAGQRALQEQVIFAEDVSLPPELELRREIYSARSFRSGRGCSFDAIYSDGPLYLGEETTVNGWLHSQSTLVLGAGCRTMGPARAQVSLQAGPGCHFHSLHAPFIAAASSGMLTADSCLAFAGSERSGRQRRTEGVYEISGACHDDVVAKGELRIRSGSVVEGDLKSRKQIVIEDGCVLRGSVVSGGDLIVGRGCSVHGPIIAEGQITMGERSRAGSWEHSTSLCAPRIRLREGSVVHGTISAAEWGKVDSPGEAA